MLTMFKQGLMQLDVSYLSYLIQISVGVHQYFPEICSLQSVKHLSMDSCILQLSITRLIAVCNSFICHFIRFASVRSRSKQIAEILNHVNIYVDPHNLMYCTYIVSNFISNGRQSKQRWANITMYLLFLPYFHRSFCYKEEVKKVRPNSASLIHTQNAVVVTSNTQHTQHNTVYMQRLPTFRRRRRQFCL